MPFLVETLQNIKPGELDEAIMLLPFDHAMRLISMLERFFSDDDKPVSACRQSVEIVAKVTIALLRIYFKQMVSNQSLKSTLIRLQNSMRRALYDLQDLIGTNIAAARTLKMQIQESQHI